MIYMRFGAHVSGAGGLYLAPINGKALGCEVIQIFTRSPQMWTAKALVASELERFKSSVIENGIEAVYIHAPYLINLASANSRVWNGSIGMLREELERGSELGCRGMMFHPGSAKDVGRENGLELVIEGLNKIMSGYKGKCQLLIEISAGAGEVMGDTFEELALMLKGANRGDEIGICFDTQHAFASGYDLRTEVGLNEVFDKFDRLIGLDRMILSHCNDSKVDFGVHKDRHEHLGRGRIGKESFKFLVNHPKLQHLDLILETPMDDGKEGAQGAGEVGSRGEDMAILKAFRNLTP